MARRKEVLSVTVSPVCIEALRQFIVDEAKSGWAINKSQVVNNAILEFIARNKDRDNAMPMVSYAIADTEPEE